MSYNTNMNNGTKRAAEDEIERVGKLEGKLERLEYDAPTGIMYAAQSYSSHQNL